jgi:hypothetical protein
VRETPNNRGGTNLAVDPALRLRCGGRFFLRLGCLFFLGFGSGLSLGFGTLLGLGFFFGFDLASAIAVGGLFTLAQDHGYRFADGHALALLDNDLVERAGVLGLDLHRGLIGFDFGYRLTLFDLVALALEPLEKGALLHRVTHLGHDHFRHYYTTSR